MKKSGFSNKQINEAMKKLGIDQNPSLREEANAIVAYTFRNGFLEDLHAGAPSKILEDDSYSRITDEEMKELMIEMCDKMEILLKIRQNDPKEYKNTIAIYHKLFCDQWKK